MKYLILILLLFFTHLLFADDIYLKNGHILKNVQVISEDDQWIEIKTTTGIDKILKHSLLKIVKSPYDENKNTEIIESDKTIIEPQTKHYYKLIYKNTYPNKNLWPVSVLASILTWDFLADAGEMQEDIDEIKKNFPDSDTSRMESVKNRKQIFGILCGVLGLANAIYAATPVKVELKDNMVNLSYHF